MHCLQQIILKSQSRFFTHNFSGASLLCKIFSSQTQTARALAMLCVSFPVPFEGSQVEAWLKRPGQQLGQERGCMQSEYSDHKLDDPTWNLQWSRLSKESSGFYCWRKLSCHKKEPHQRKTKKWESLFLALETGIQILSCVLLTVSHY